MDTHGRPARGAARKHPSPVVALVGFVLFVGAGLAILAGVVLVPELAAADALARRRDALARQLESEQKLSIYNDRVMWALEGDPIHMTRMMMRHRNFHLAGARPMETTRRAKDTSVPARLLREAARPADPPDPLLAYWAGRLREGWTGTALAGLAAVMIATGVMLFGCRHPRRDAPPGPPG